MGTLRGAMDSAITGKLGSGKSLYGVTFLTRESGLTVSKFGAREKLSLGRSLRQDLRDVRTTLVGSTSPDTAGFLDAVRSALVFAERQLRDVAAG